MLLLLHVLVGRLLALPQVIDFLDFDANWLIALSLSLRLRRLFDEVLEGALQLLLLLILLQGQSGLIVGASLKFQIIRDLLCLVNVIVLDFVLRLPGVKPVFLYLQQLLKVIFVHDASNEVAKPEHGRVLDADRHLTVVHMLQSVPHWCEFIELIFTNPDRVVR